MIQSGDSRRQVAEQYPSVAVRYHRGLEYVRELYTVPRDWPTEAIVYWGPTGSGKTYHVNELVGINAFFLTKSATAGSGQVWWDGYENQETIVIEEFYGWLPVTTVLNLINSQPFTVQVKGGTRSIVAKRVFFTSNVNPCTWYKELPPSVDQALKRRLSPPFGHVFFLGYGEKKDQAFCDCNSDDCWKVHEVEAAWAPGMKRVHSALS